MKITKGTTRRVLIISEWAIKFPRISVLLQSLWLIGDSDFSNTFRRGCQQFIDGLVANLTEFKVSLLSERIKFLAPVYFSCGLFSIQKRALGQKPTYDEMNTVLRELPENAQYQLLTMDPHLLDIKNFVKTDKGIVMVDYAGDNFSSTSLIWFLYEWKDELNDQFAKAPA